MRERGQHFLIDQSVLRTIIQSAHLSPHDRVLEVGAGFGQLTLALLDAGAQVWAVESDAKFMSALQKIQTQHAPHTSASHLTLIHKDIRKLNISELVNESHYTVVSNLPYNITSWFLRMMLEQKNKPISMTLLLQKDVAERIVAQPGHMSLLALSVQYYARPKIIRIVSKASFWPKPEVDSAIIHFANIHELNFAYEKKLFQIARIAFAGKRKQLCNSLSAGLQKNKNEITAILKSVHIKPTQRPQELSLQQWKLLAENL